MSKLRIFWEYILAAYGCSAYLLAVFSTVANF